MSSYRGMSSQSPHSSSGHADSADGTPNTSLTAFSPEDVKNPRALIGGAPIGVSFGAFQHDPFITTTQQSARSLSATASTFHPLYQANQGSSSSSIAGPSLTAKGKQVDTVVQRLDLIEQHSVSPTPTQEGTFSTDTSTTRCFRVKSNYDVDVVELVEQMLQTIVGGGYKFIGRKTIIVHEGVVYVRFSHLKEATDTYHAIKTSSPNLTVKYIDLGSLSLVLSPRSAKKSAHEGQVVLTATYPVDLSIDKKSFEVAMRNMLQIDGPLCAWQKISATEAGTLRLIAEFYDIDIAKKAVKRCRKISEETSARDSLKLDVMLHEPDLALPRAMRTQATPTRKSTEPSALGDAMSSMTIGSVRPTNTEIAAFRTPIAAPPSETVGMYANGPYMLSPSSQMGGMGTFYAPNHVGLFQQGFLPALSPQIQHPHSGHQNAHRIDYGYGELASVSNFAQPLFNNEANDYAPGRFQRSMTYDRPSGRRQNAVKVPHHNRGRLLTPTSAHHNHVEVTRIREGSDVRTTVMLRNIPNKLNQAQLKAILDASSFGKYDFMYLRIDFSNNCNVGYAFINFNDPLDIVKFVEARSGQKWDRYKSDKVAEVSYATIQGKDCLVQKFRNSSVMLEPPHYRPKLYITDSDTYGRPGDEEPFPESDNASKLKRSCENAEHVGLFAPSASQHMRDEQRRRRSQYDRGTSLAEREEWVYEGYETGKEEFSEYSPNRYSPPY